ncbi:type IV secretory system conjugative DNA transfer family protein [Listeria goaensis]|uniref:type IV secretory system conjugative DNA transfer family protein n=1 Tax=Listeria goaensis TaxID=1649188 RepID=UPI000B5874DA|nr:type IV secretory system conjugative DNA transfer family protein [Listeria goaensis]
MGIRKKRFKDSRKHTPDEWRDNRNAAYRSKLTLLAKPKGLALFGVIIYLLQIYALNVIIGIVLLFKEQLQVFLHSGESANQASFLQTLIQPIILTFPTLFLFCLVFFLFTTAYLCLKVHRSFRALEDIQNTNANKWQDTEGLLQQYRIMWADPDIPFDGIGGIPIAHIRPSVLEKFGLSRPNYLDDANLQLNNQESLDEQLALTELEVKEIQQQSKFLRHELPENEKEYAILLADENTNAINLGITRAGKGVFFVNPTIDAFSRSRVVKNKASFFIADTKGIALRENFSMLKERGYDVLVMNVANPFYSNSFSPLFTAVRYYEEYLFKSESLSDAHRLRKLDFATQDIASLASILYIRPRAGDKFFVDNARALFRACTIALMDHCLRTEQKEKICLYAISKTMSHLMGITINRKMHPYLMQYVTSQRPVDDLYADYKGKSALDVYFGEMDQDHPASDAYGAIRLVGDAKQTIAGIASELIIALDPFVRSGNARLTADNAFDFKKMGFGEKPQAIFLVFPDSDSSNEELASLFLETAYRELVREADASANGACDRLVIFLLDEFGNLMKIPGMSQKMSAVLSRNIRFFLILQNLGQLDIYEKHEKSTMLSNAGITFYIKSNDKETNEEIVDRLKKRTVASFSRNGEELSLKKTVSESAKDVDMMSRNSLEQLQFGENVILRVSRTTDLEERAITQYPILNQGPDRMVPSFWYLPHQVVPWEEIPIDNHHVELTLKGYAIELGPLQMYDTEEEKSNQAEIDQNKQEETIKFNFKKAVQKTYKANQNYYRNCVEVWKETTYVEQIQQTLFTKEKMALDPDNLADGENRLLRGTVSEFTQWLEMEDQLRSVQEVGRILELEGWKEVT